MRKGRSSAVRNVSSPLFLIKCPSEKIVERQHLENLFDNLPESLPKELVSVIAKNRRVRIERIVSTGHCSPDDFWYEQSETEWVLVLQGEGHLRIEGQRDLLKLKQGDHILIPALKKHRVEWTCPKKPTVWLAVFFAD